nr:toxin glutamine deamidase domain-containing protein [Micromonospora tarapacensis]
MAETVRTAVKATTVSRGKQPGMAGALLTPDGEITTHTSMTGDKSAKPTTQPRTHPLAQAALDRTAAALGEGRGKGHGKCAEVALVSDQLYRLEMQWREAGEPGNFEQYALDALAGSKIVTHQVAPAVSNRVRYELGHHRPPCNSCAHFLPQFDVEPITDPDRDVSVYQPPVPGLAGTGPPLSDGRPLGQPDGLVPPARADQDALDAAVPQDPSTGRPLAHPDPRVGRWGDLVNDGGPTVTGRDNNCADVGLSVLSTWFGRPEVAAPTAPSATVEVGSTARQEQALRASFAHQGSGTTGLDAVAEALRSAGPGSAALIVTSWAGEPGAHTWNAVNHDGTIVWFDGQNRLVSDTDPLHAARVDEVWSIVLDAEGDPVGRSAPEVSRPAPVPPASTADAAAAIPPAGRDRDAGPTGRPGIDADATRPDTPPGGPTTSDTPPGDARPGSDPAMDPESDPGPDAVANTDPVAWPDMQGWPMPDTRRIGPDQLAPLEDARYQDDVADSLRTPEGYEVSADPSTHPYGQLINDGGPDQPGRGNNCVDNILAALASFRGDPQVSYPRWPDRLDDGSLETELGELDGFGRIESWIGGDWTGDNDILPGTPDERSAALADRYEQLYQRIRDAGPGSAAVVAVEWLQFDEHTGAPLVDADGSTRGAAQHVFLLVYPEGADGPVWWDPQFGSTTTDPLPGDYVELTHNLWSMEVQPSHADEQGGSPRVDDQTARDGQPGGDLPVRVRLGSPGDSLPAAADPGPAVGPGGLHHRPDGGGDRTSQPAATTDHEAVRDGPTGGPDNRPSGLAGTESDGLSDADASAPDGDRAETRYLDGLSETDQATLLDALTEARLDADQILADLQSVNAEVAARLGLTGADALSVLGEQHRVKGAESLARKFRSEMEPLGYDMASALDTVNDVVRFSVRGPESEAYGPAVDSILSSLEAQGYQVTDLKNFWHPGNRFFGLNCTLTAPSGRTFELQFPTATSYAIGTRTHVPYEVMRDPEQSPAARVQAFLDILAINKANGIAASMPGGMETTRFPPPKDTSFAKWMASPKQAKMRQEYLDWLAGQGATFADVLAERGLTASDLPGLDFDLMGGPHGGADVRLLPPAETGRSDRPAGQRDRGGEQHGVDPGGDLGPAEAGLDVPPGRGGGDPVGEPRTSRDRRGRPGDGRAPGGALHRGSVADRGRVDGDLPPGDPAADARGVEAWAGDLSGAGPQVPGAIGAAPSVPIDTDHGLPQTRRLGPGELAPLEDPGYQWDVEQSLRTPEGYALFADPSTHPYGRLVNDGGPGQPGRGNNCLDSSLSALSSFYGDPRVSFPRWADVRPDGSIEAVTGEASGLDRAEQWLGVDWSGGSAGLPTTPAEHAAAVADQYARLHQRVAEAGPGSAALVVAEWIRTDPRTGDVVLDRGSVQVQDSHAFVLVYPEGADGPVWWDPQRGMTWPQPPAAYVAQTYALWSMTTSVGGVTDDGGRGADADQASAGHGERDRAASVRVRVVGEGTALDAGTGGGQATGPRELHHRPDGSDHGADESAGTAADHGVHTGPPGGPDDGSAGLADGGTYGLTAAPEPSLPESRRYGPGELAPLEDIRFQGDLAASLATPDGYSTFADPSTHPYGQLVNDGGPDQPGRGNNCLDCSLAALASFHGDPQVSVPRWADRSADGSIDRVSGERGGLARAGAWIGGEWTGGPDSLPADPAARTDAVARQYADLYQRVADAGPGASALVVADWLFVDDAGDVVLDETGRPEVDGSHAFVIVFPADADAPMWWDPQTGTTSPDMPAADVWETHALWAMMMPDREGRVDRGRGADADQPTAGDPEPDRASGVRVRLAGPGETLGTGTGLGDARGSGELHHRPLGSDHGPLQPAAPPGDGGVRAGTPRGPDQGPAGVARGGTDGLTNPDGPPGPPSDRDSTSHADGPDLRQAAAGTTFGGALLDADPARTGEAVQAALTGGLLPDGASVELATGIVTLDTLNGPYQVRIELTDPPADTPIVPVATIQHTADGAVVQMSTGAHPDHVRRAVASTLAEVDTVAQDRAAGLRFDATTALAEGARPEGSGVRVLTARDIGHLAELRVVLTDSSAASGPARVGQLRAEALSLLVSSGLLEQAPAHSVHGHERSGNRPVVGSSAAQARLDVIRNRLGSLAPEVESLIGIARSDGQQLVADLRAAQSAVRAEARAWAQQATALRNEADLALTATVDAALDAAPDHVFGRLVIGGGWAATADFVTIGAPADTGSGLPPVLCVSQGHDPWAERQTLLMGQVPSELELPGLPFQPADLAEEGTQFTPSDVFADAVGAARALSGMPTYQGLATSVTPRPVDAVGWPDGANYRVTIGGRAVFTASVDIATGPGPSRVPSAPTTTSGRYVDPATGYRVDRSGRAPVFRDPAGVAVDPASLPPTVRAVLGGPGNGRADLPLLTDLTGRPTDPLVVEPTTGYAVDTVTGQLHDPAGGPVDPRTLPEEVAARLGHAPDGSFTDPRPTAPPVDFGGQNLADAYQPGDRVLVYGAGPSGAWDIEQAAASTAGRVDWSAQARPLPPDRVTGDPVVDAQRQLEYSFSGGDNRRNNLPGLGAYSDAAQARVADMSLREVVGIRHTVDGAYLVRFSDGTEQVYDRVVLSIGQEPRLPGGVHTLLSEVELSVLEGPSLDADNPVPDVLGLRDGSGQLRVLGGASVAGALMAEAGTAVRRAVALQAAALPDDSRGIPPSIRFHAQRIAEANRGTPPVPSPDGGGSAPLDSPSDLLPEGGAVQLPAPLDVEPGQRAVPLDQLLPERGHLDPDGRSVDVLPVTLGGDLNEVVGQVDVAQGREILAGGEGLGSGLADAAARQAQPAQPAQVRGVDERGKPVVADRVAAQVEGDQTVEAGDLGDPRHQPGGVDQDQVADGVVGPDLGSMVDEGASGHGDRLDQAVTQLPSVEQMTDRVSEPGTDPPVQVHRFSGAVSVGQVEMDQLGALGVGGLDGVGVAPSQVEVVGVGEDGGVEVGGRGHDASVSTDGSITAGAVPGSTFHGLGRPVADPAAVLDLARVALPQVAPYAQVDAVVPVGPNLFEIRTVGQHPLTVRLATGPLTEGTVARATRDPDGTFTVTVSDRAADPVVARALAHEVAELVALHESGRALVGPLDPGNVQGPIDPAGLTAHDRGRMAELRLLAAGYADADPATRLAVRGEIDSLAGHLGLRVGDPDVRARWALLPRDVLAHLMQLSVPSITPDAVSGVLAGAATLTEVERVRMIDYRARLAPDFQVPPQADLDARLRELATTAEHAQSGMPRMPAFAGQIVALPARHLDRIRTADPQLADRLAVEGVYVDLTGRYDLRPYMVAAVPAIDLGAARPTFDLTTEDGRRAQLHEDRQRARAALRGLPGDQAATLLAGHDFHYQGTARWMGLVPDALTEALRGITPAPAPAATAETAATGEPSGNVRIVADRVTLPPDSPKKPGPVYGPALDARTGQPPPLFDGPPKRTDVQQGALGDCGMIAVIGSVAGHLPDTIAQMFHPNPDGSVDVVLHETSGPGHAVTPTGRQLRVTVWPDVPLYPNSNGRSAYADQSTVGAAWASLLEKAIAAVDRTWTQQRHDQWQQQWTARPGTDAAQAAPLGYARLDNGSSRLVQAELLSQLTGLPIGVSQLDPTPGREADAETRLATLLAAGSPLVTGTRPADAYSAHPGGKPPYGLVAGHAYEIVAVVNGEVQLRNPWNSQHPSRMPVRAFLDLMSPWYAHVELARSTVPALPGSEFHGHGRPAADAPAVVDRARTVLPALAEPIGADQVVAVGPDVFEVRSTGLDPLRVRVTAGTLADGVVAQTTRNLDGTFTLTVSDRASDAVVDRAVAHEAAELLARHETGEAQVGLFDQGAAEGPIDPARLSARDRGRLAELRLMAAGYPQADPTARLALRAEIDTLVDRLGLRWGTPEAAARLAVLPADVWTQVMQLSLPVITPDAVSGVLAYNPNPTMVERFRAIDYRSRLAPDFLPPPAAELDAKLRELAVHGEQSQSSIPRMPALAGQLIGLPPALLDPIRQVDPQLADRIAAEGIYVDLTGRFDLRPYTLDGAPEFTLDTSAPAYDLNTGAGRNALLVEDRSRIEAAFNVEYGANPAAVAVLTTHTFHYLSDARRMGLVPKALTKALQAMMPPEPDVEVEVTPTVTTSEIAVVADRVTLPDPNPKYPIEYGRALQPATGQPAPLLDGPPRRTQVQQGMLGDCGMLATMAALAGHRPESIPQLFQPRPDGTVDVLLHESVLRGDGSTATGRRIRINVRPDVPVRAGSSWAAYANQAQAGTSWASVLEKALAAVDRTWTGARHEQWQREWRGWHSKDDPHRAAPTGYARLNVGSTALMQAELLTQLTGLPARQTLLDVTPGRESEVERQLAALLGAGSPITIATWPKESYAGRLPDGLKAKHVYEIVTVQDGQVQLHNPWNTEHPSPMPVRALLDLMQPWCAHLEQAPAAVSPPAGGGSAAIGHSPIPSPRTSAERTVNRPLAVPSPPLVGEPGPLAEPASSPRTRGRAHLDDERHAISYFALLATDGTVIGLMVSEVGGPGRSLHWTAGGVAPGQATPAPVERAEAERIARDVLGFLLPAEPALYDMLDT